MAIKSKKVVLAPRERRKIRIRKRIKGTEERPRLCVFRSRAHTHAQIISDQTGTVLISASTVEPDVRAQIASVDTEGLTSKAKSVKSIAGAKAVGLVIAKRCLAKKLDKVVFDRNGFIYHGRVKAVADGAREGGLIL